MKKYVIIICLVIIFILGFIFYPKNTTKRELITELTPLECDLNKSACQVNYKNKKIIFEFDEKPLKILKETKVIIKNLEKFDNLNAKLYGLNMYMGDIISEFEYINNEYVGTLVFSSCIESTMRYRFELFDGKKELGIFIDFDVKR
ncbi:hypothetical protein [Campylobacter sp. MG1]|uniref:hypothetical protein n=1 Tax=Campylobacter sp. MG1 TaxID=2976332 RepID=UPI00226CEB8E|nr:hypothetical protein [Campylobacter sp. MG1]